MRFTRAGLGLLLLLLYTAVSDARWIYRAGRGLIEARGRTTSPGMSSLPRIEAGASGAGSDRLRHGTGPEGFTTEDFRRFLLTEYALAPLVLINDTVPELIVGNFTPDSVPSAPPAPDLQLVRDFGDGVWLLRKVRR